MSLIAGVRHLHHLRIRSIWAMTKRRHFTGPTAISFEDAIKIDQRLLLTDYDPLNHRSPPTDRVWRLVDEVIGLTQIKALELSDVMIDKFCRIMTSKLSFKERYVIRLTRPEVAVSEKSGEGKPELKKALDLRIESFEVASKLKVFKEIRRFLELGLNTTKIWTWWEFVKRVK